MAYAAHTVKSIIVYNIDGQTVQNTFDWVYADVPGVAELGSLLSNMADAWIARLKPLLPSVLLMTGITATDVSSPTGARASTQLEPMGGDITTGDYLPLNATIAITKSTGERGRGNQGRIFWPVLLEDQVTGDQVNLDYIGDIETALNSFQGDVEGLAEGGPNMVVAHATGVRAGTNTPVLLWRIADRYVDSQRDRLPRHKRHRKHPAAVVPAP